MQSTAARQMPDLVKAIALTGARGPSLFDSLFPAATTLHRVIAAVAMVAITAGAAQARFYLPENPVPVTFSMFGVLLTGGLLGFRWGLVSALLYYFAGMAGLSVFQGANGGWDYVTNSPTGGYLIGFIFASAITGFLAQRGWNRGKSLWPMLVSTLFVYVPGLVWLSVMDLGWPAEGELFSAGMYPFIPGDIVKVMLAALVVGGLWRVADHRAERRAMRSNTER